MKEDDSQAAAGLHALCRQAGEQATAWQAGTRPAGAVARAAAPAAVDRKPLLKIGAVGGLGLIGLAVVAAQFRSPAPATGAVMPMPVPEAKAAPQPPLPLSAPLPATVVASPPEITREIAAPAAAPARAATEAAPTGAAAAPAIKTPAELELEMSQPGGSC